jgi:hypothetical protein
VGVGDDFLKMLVKRGGLGFRKSKTRWAYMHIPNLILNAKEISTPTLILTKLLGRTKFEKLQIKLGLHLLDMKKM